MVSRRRTRVIVALAGNLPREKFELFPLDDRAKSSGKRYELLNLP